MRLRDLAAETQGGVGRGGGGGGAGAGCGDKTGALPGATAGVVAGVESEVAGVVSLGDADVPASDASDPVSSCRLSLERCSR